MFFACGSRRVADVSSVSPSLEQTVLNMHVSLCKSSGKYMKRWKN